MAECVVNAKLNMREKTIMSVSVTEYIDLFIEDVNNAINWKYLKSRRVLKKEINDIVFQICVI